MLRLQRGSYGAVQKLIAVAAADGTVAGVKLGIHLPRPKHGHRIGQRRVYPSHPGRSGPDRLRIEVDDLFAGVHAPICPPCGGDADRLPRNDGERRLERVLNGVAAWLGLPTEKAASVIFDAESDPRRSLAQPGK